MILNLKPEIEELLELEKEPLPTEEVTNTVSDANDTREKDFEDYGRSHDEIDQDVMESTKELEAQYFAEAAANNTTKVPAITSTTDVKTDEKKPSGTADINQT